LRGAIVTNEVSSKLGALFSFPPDPLSLTDLLHTIGERFRIWALNLWVFFILPLSLVSIVSAWDIGPLFVFLPFLSGLLFL
jgi:hypothetical protein